MNRRGFLTGILALGAAPAIVRAESLMKIWVPPQDILCGELGLWGDVIMYGGPPRFFVHCGKCSHEWALGLMPMPVGLSVKVMKSPCPACGSKKIFMGLAPKPTAVRLPLI